MSPQKPMLHMVCGKIASGKSTLSAELAGAPNTILVSEDAWLDALYGEQIQDGADYLRYSARLRTIMAPHVTALLDVGLTVVLDFAANTLAQRKWMADIVRASGAAHQLHYLDVADDTCLNRLRARNAEGSHAFAATEEQFRRFTAHFVPPTEDEGFTLVRHDGQAR